MLKLLWELTARATLVSMHVLTTFLYQHVSGGLKESIYSAYVHSNVLKMPHCIASAGYYYIA